MSDDLDAYILHPSLHMFGSQGNADKDPEDRKELTRPPNTIYERIGNVGPLHIAYIPDIDSHMINHYLLTSRMPLLVVFLIVFGATTAFVLHQKVSILGSWVIYLDAVVMCLELISFLSIIIEGPGYLPFYYPSPLPPSVNGDPTHISGLVTTEEQLTYAKAQKPPHNVKFFSTARRFVIRGDHFCYWSGCFIGKKNFKLFTLFNLYGLLFNVITMSWIGMTMMNIIKHSDDDALKELLLPLICGSIVLLYGVFFVIFQMLMMIQCIGSIYYNHTQVEVHKKTKHGIKVKKTGKPCEFCVYMFGPVGRWYTWLCPIGAYHGVDDYMLVDPPDTENEPFIHL